jgi:hypothetical protein
MQSKAHPTRAGIAHSSLLTGIGDRFIAIVPAFPDDFLMPITVCLGLIYFIADMLINIPIWCLVAYFGTIIVVGSAIFARNGLAEGRAKKARQHEHDHDAEHNRR